MTHKSASCFRMVATLFACLSIVVAVWLSQHDLMARQNVSNVNIEQENIEIAISPAEAIVDPVPPAAATAAKLDEKTRALENYGQLPMSFEPNQGQVGAKQVKFSARGNGYNLFLTPTEAVLALPQANPKKQQDRAKDQNREEVSYKHLSDKQSKKPIKQMFVRMQLIDSNKDARFAGGDELEGKSNYFIGNDPSKWRTNVPNYKKARFEGVYDGVDLEYYGNQRQLEYDFLVKPQADPSKIKLQFKGARQVNVDDSGELVLKTSAGEIRQHKPMIYQEMEDGGRQEVAGGYSINGKDVSFWLSEYDRSKRLVIDPVLVYSTYLGGTGVDQGYAVAVDGSGNAYVAGFTVSPNFPLQGARQGSPGIAGGNSDVFVTKFNAAGSGLIYSTYHGGTGSEFGKAVAVDSAGNAYVTGSTDSTDFPLQNARQGTKAAGDDVFVTKFNATGNALVYSTYHGGNTNESGDAIAVDSSGNAYVTGFTNSSNFPLQGARQGTYGGNSDAFVTKFNAAGSALLYSTYHGGSDIDSTFGIAVDGSGNAYVTGYTYSTNFPLQVARQGTNGSPGSPDAFVSKFNAAGSALLYSTYHGGNGNDYGRAIAVDSAGNAYVAGDTQSTNFPIQSARQGTNAGNGDAYISKFNAAGSALLYSTYHGGSGAESGSGITVDGSGNAYITGYTSSTDFPLQNARQGTNAGNGDAFISKFNAAGSALLYSTYHGGSGAESGSKIAVDGSGNAYVTGNTSSTDFPLVAPRQATNGGSNDAFLLKISDPPIFSVTGKVTRTGQPVQGAQIIVSGSETYSIFTNSTGDYQLSLLQNQNYTITPQFQNAIFSPSNYTFTPISSNQTGKDFAFASVTNDNFVNGMTMSTTSIQGTNVSATREPNEPNHAGQTGGKSVWYKWTAPTSASYRFSVVGQGFADNVLLGIYTGSSVGSLTAVDTSSYRTLSSLLFFATQGVEYEIAIDGQNGTSGNFVLSYVTPTVFAQGTIKNANGNDIGPVNVTVSCGGNFTQTQNNVFGTYSIDLPPGFGPLDCVTQPSGLGVTTWIQTIFFAQKNFTPGSPVYTVSGILNGLTSIDPNLMVTLSGANIQAGNCQLTTLNTNPPQIRYDCFGLAHLGNYVVTPSLPQYGFTPQASTYNSIVANFQNQNFNATTNPLPTIGSISPTSAAANSPTITLTVNGTNYMNGSAVRWNGQDRTTSFVSATQLTAQIPAADLQAAGTAQVSVFNPAPGGGTTPTSITFTINPPSANLGITKTDNASTATLGGATIYTIVANNSGPSAVTGATVADSFPAAITSTTWTCVGAGSGTCPASGNGNISANVNLPVGASVTFTATANISPTATGSLSNTATITAPAGVTDPTLGNNTATDADTFVSPVPTITTISPTFAPVGGSAFTMTVNGSNFVGSSVVRWNGVGRTTSFVSGAQLTVQIPATDLQTAGAYPITVFNPAPGGGGTPNAVNFFVNNPVAFIRGRLTTPEGRGVRGAALTLINSVGFTRYAMANSFGYYSLDYVPTGATYTLNIVSKRYGFVSRQFELNIDRPNEDFVGSQLISMPTVGLLSFWPR